MQTGEYYRDPNNRGGGIIEEVGKLSKFNNGGGWNNRGGWKNIVGIFVFASGVGHELLGGCLIRKTKSFQICSN